jgi:head-tail adaptor
MVMNSNYQEEIKNYTWEDLETLWAAIQQRDTPEWESGKAFE